MKVGFEKCYEVFAVIRIYPYAVLQMNEANRLQSITNFVARPLSILRNIKYEHSPFTVPPPRILYRILACLKRSQNRITFIRKKEFSSFPREKAGCDETVARARDNILLPRRADDTKLGHGHDHVRSNNKHAHKAGKFDGIKNNPLEFTVAGPPQTFLFHIPHVPILRGRGILVQRVLR